MKGIVFRGKHDLRLEDVQEPECREGEAILEVKYAGVCGSDLTIYQGKHTRAKPPTILGHEFSGIVVARRGEGYPQVKVGERVAVDPSYACNQCELCRTGNAHICHTKGLYGVDSDGGFARYVKVALSAPHKIPEWATFEEGVLIEPLAVAVRAVSISRLSCGEYALVLGGGPIGLLTAQVARIGGAARVLLVEPQAFRRTMAREMDFTVLTAEEATREQIAELTGGRGVDVVFDAAGVAPAARMATQLVKRTGRIVIVAVYKEPVPFDLITLGYGENQILGSCIYTYKDFVKSVTLLEGRRVDLRPLVTHRLPLEDGIGAIDSLTKGMSAQKVLLAVS
jgi:(R,R)-butanediol dehydrogenase / meso-butanediol dehydrogenase / diacetyl reductase